MFDRRIVPLLLIALVVGLGHSLTTLSIATADVVYPFGKIANDKAAAIVTAPSSSCTDTDLGYFEYTFTLPPDKIAEIQSALVAEARVSIQWITKHTFDNQRRGFTQVGERWTLKARATTLQDDNYTKDSPDLGQGTTYFLTHSYGLRPADASLLGVDATFTVKSHGHALAKIQGDCGDAPPMYVYAEWELDPYNPPILAIFYKEKKDDIP